jgi:hypothetical protein
LLLTKGNNNMMINHSLTWSKSSKVIEILYTFNYRCYKRSSSSSSLPANKKQIVIGMNR